MTRATHVGAGPSEDLSVLTIGAGFARPASTDCAAQPSAPLAEADGWSYVDQQKVHSDGDMLDRRLGAMCGGLQSSSPQAQDLIAPHYAIVSPFCVPSKEAHIGMSLFYNENLEMKTFHDECGPGPVAFLSEAMKVYAHSVRHGRGSVGTA